MACVAENIQDTLQWSHEISTCNHEIYAIRHKEYLNRKGLCI